MAKELLTTAQAAQRLGVKPATLYAYVSRGVLRRIDAPDGRRSLFDAAQIDAIARRGRPRRTSRPFVFEIEIETSITELTEHTLKFRGHDAIRLARTASFEQVAALLWTGELPSLVDAHAEPWVAASIARPQIGDCVDRIRQAIAMAAAVDPLRADLSPAAVMASAKTIVSTSIDSLEPMGGERTPRLDLANGEPPIRGSIAGRVDAARAGTSTARVGGDRQRSDGPPGRPRARGLDVRRTCRRVDPRRSVRGGLGGPRPTQWSSPRRGEPRHRERCSTGRPAPAVHRRRSPMHSACTDDARASVTPCTEEVTPGPRHCCALLRAACGGTRAMSTVDGVMAAAQRRVPVAPNVDAALAAMGHVLGMPVDAGEAMFAIARTVGWVAHALEEYQAAPVRFRPRARFVPTP